MALIPIAGSSVCTRMVPPLEATHSSTVSFSSARPTTIKLSKRSFRGSFITAATVIDQDPPAPDNLRIGRDIEDASEVLIECKDVYKSFGEKHILQGVSFKIRHGEAVGIIGPSGTGKSTILKIMAGLLTPDKGEVFIRGKKRRGLISDEEISGLRIGLVLLYDEPTAGLDPIASTVVEDLIRSVHLKSEDVPGKLGSIASYVVVTHQHSTIKRAVDRLLFLYEGKVVWQGMTHEFTSSTNPIVRQVLSDPKFIHEYIDLQVKRKP
ncbi:Protein TRIGALACTOSYLDIACYLGLYCEROL 3 [Ranunculus cassubicifolius]